MKQEKGSSQVRKANGMASHISRGKEIIFIDPHKRHPMTTKIRYVCDGVHLVRRFCYMSRRL